MPQCGTMRAAMRHIAWRTAEKEIVMLDSATIARIRDAVDAGFEEQVALTAELVRIPSLMGAERPAQELMARALADCGLEVDRWRIEVEALRGMHGFSPPEVAYDQALGVVGIQRAAAAGGRSLILNGHVDVVPVGPPERWTRDPFGAEIAGGWMYGRGAADMKAGTAACAAAVKALRRAGVRLAGDLFVESVIEEEVTGNGTLACVQRGYRADFAVITEPTSTTYVEAQVGLMWFEVMVAGNPRHPSLAGTTRANAIDKAFLLAQALAGLEQRWNAEKAKHPRLAQLERPIVIYVGKIEGGDWTSSVPAWCRFEVRVGTYPGWERDWVRQEVERCLLEAAAADPFLSRFPPAVRTKGQYGEGYLLEGGAEAIEALRRSHREVFARDLQAISSGGSSDARILGIDGRTPTVQYGPVGRDYHGYDEAVDLESLRLVTQSVALFAAEWCGVAT
jgi:acetylornithine deacetylase